MAEKLTLRVLTRKHYLGFITINSIVLDMPTVIKLCAPIALCDGLGVTHYIVT